MPYFFFSCLTVQMSIHTLTGKSNDRNNLNDFVVHINFSTDTYQDLCQHYEALEKSCRIHELNKLKDEVEMSIIHMQQESEPTHVKLGGEGKKQWTSKVPEKVIVRTLTSFVYIYVHCHMLRSYSIMIIFYWFCIDWCWKQHSWYWDILGSMATSKSDRRLKTLTF